MSLLHTGRLLLLAETSFTHARAFRVWKNVKFPNSPGFPNSPVLRYLGNSQKIYKFQQWERGKGKVFFCDIFSWNCLKYVYLILFTSFSPGHLHQGQGQSVLKISFAMTRNFLVMDSKKWVMMECEILKIALLHASLSLSGGSYVLA